MPQGKGLRGECASATVARYRRGEPLRKPMDEQLAAARRLAAERHAATHGGVSPVRAVAGDQASPQPAQSPLSPRARNTQGGVMSMLRGAAASAASENVATAAADAMESAASAHCGSCTAM